MRRGLVIALVAGGLADARPLHGEGLDLAIPIVFAENVMVLGPPALYYWRTPDDQDEDWDYRWDWPSWRRKLFTLDALVLDTNRFEANALRHPLAGALTYQIGRANGLGMFGSTVMNFTSSVFWEYVVEFKERPAINDLFANTVAGILIGEPLFDLALSADARPTFARRALLALASPFHRVQEETKLSSLAAATAGRGRFEVITGVTVSRALGMALGLELEGVRDKTWNRVSFDVRFGGDRDTAFAGGSFRSSTTYAGWLDRTSDRETYLGIGGGFDAFDRRLETEWDKFAVFQLAMPRAAMWWHGNDSAFGLETAASADIGMIQSHALVDVELVADSSIVRTRGYYYGTGVSGQLRARARRGIWSLDVETVAHQQWSFDEHSYGGDTDPRDLADLRWWTRGAIGVTVGDEMRLELFGARLFARGTGDDLARDTSELEAGLAMHVGF